MRFPTSASAALARPPRSHHIHNHTQHTARAHLFALVRGVSQSASNMLLVALACSCLPRPAIEFNALARSPLSDGLDGLPQKYSIDICQLRGGERNDTAFGWRYMIKTPIVASAAFVGYLSGSQFLDLALVQALGVDRSASADAFAPFVTLLGLVYSVILAQIYTYYFERQGAIQTAIFDEAAALRALQGCVEAILDDESLMEQRALLLGSLHSHTTDVLRTGFDGVFRHGRSPRPLVKLLSALETASDTTLRRVAVLQLARVNVGRVYDARSRRFAAESAQLPTVQIVTQRLIAGVLLLGFVLVDLGAPKLEALLFGVLAATFFIISSFLADLADPFGGSWSVEPARHECLTLLDSLARAGCRILPPQSDV